MPTARIETSRFEISVHASGGIGGHPHPDANHKAISIVITSSAVSICFIKPSETMRARYSL
jgi:hypothetical protein